MSCSALFRALRVATAASFLAGAAFAQSPDDVARARTEIWAKEQAIYGGRASGSLSNYIEFTSPHYLAWPPVTPLPITREGLRKTTPRIAGAHEIITSELTDFTLSGDTAVIYYVNHRTRMGDGSPVDQKYQNIHVWVKEAGSWKVLGGMSRLEK